MLQQVCLWPLCVHAVWISTIWMGLCPLVVLVVLRNMQPIGRGVISPPPHVHSPCPIPWNETKHSMSKQRMTHSASLSLQSSWFPNWVCLRLFNYFNYSYYSLLLPTTCSSLTGWKCPQTMGYHSAIEAYRGCILNVKLSNTISSSPRIITIITMTHTSPIPVQSKLCSIDVGKLAILAVNLILQSTVY